MCSLLILTISLLQFVREAHANFGFGCRDRYFERTGVCRLRIGDGAIG